MNNEAPQKLQTAGGAEREARAAVRYTRQLIDKWADTGLHRLRWKDMGIDIIDAMQKCANECANEARLEALEQAAGAASTCDIRAIGEGAIRIRIAEKIRALKAATEVK